MSNIEKLKADIDRENIPRHIGIIMDGNGRWAKKRFLPRNFGHQEGMERVIDVVSYGIDLGLESLSLFAFSTENWKRPKEEVNGLMKILVEYIKRELKKLDDAGVKLKIMGDITKLPELARIEVERAIETTKDNSKMVLNIGLNYGGQDEIIYAVKNILKDNNMGKINVEDLDKDIFESYLYTKDQPMLDLLIRPSGEMRISNFMLYQLAYAELYFSNILWPDFGEKDFLEAILSYQNRDRRFGGI